MRMSFFQRSYGGKNPQDLRSSHGTFSRISSFRAFHALASALASLALLVGLCIAPSTASAAGIIKQPGAHNKYTFELEPQLVLRPFLPAWNGGGYGCRYQDCRNYNNGYYYSYRNHAGVGPGIRATIPLMHNGPIDSINNNIAISFGLSTTFHSTYYRDTNAVVLNLPVAFQWNFYLTKIISVLGEAGLNTPITFWGGTSHLNVEPLFQAGGRFQFGKIGILVRIGYPLLSVGANIQF